MKPLTLLLCLFLISCEKRVVTKEDRARAFLVEWFKSGGFETKWADELDLPRGYSFGRFAEVETGVLLIVNYHDRNSPPGPGSYIQPYEFLLRSVGKEFQIERIAWGASSINDLFENHAGIAPYPRARAMMNKAK